MKKQLAVCMASVVLASSAMAVVTNTFQIGGEGSDSGWNANVTTNAGVTPTEYSITFGTPERYAETEISNLTFSVTFTETNGVPVYISYGWLGAGTTTNSGPDRRINSNEVMQLNVAYSDPNNALLGLRLTGVGTMWNTKTFETMVFSDGVSSTNITDSSNDTIFDYEAMGLELLSADNVDTWSLFVSADDSLGGGTNFTESGMGAFVLEYIADVDYVSSYVSLTPVSFAFLNNGEMDGAALGTTMTRSNGWDSAVTITNVEVIGQDLTLASEGQGGKPNVYTNPGNSLGINSVNNGSYGNEGRDFNPNEGWIISFDTDVYLEEIDLASTATDTVMTVSSDVFPDFVLLGNGVASNGTFNLADTFVPAGTNVTFQMTSTTNASDTSIRIAYLDVQVVADQESYQAWIQDQDLTSELNDGYGDDPDADTMDNLMEFALGGDPLVDDASTVLPGYELAADGTTNYMNYIYSRRIQFDVSGLNYAVGSTLDLVLAPATNITEEVGSGAIDAEYESVTNRISTDVEDKQFMQLEVTID